MPLLVLLALLLLPLAPPRLCLGNVCWATSSAIGNAPVGPNGSDLAAAPVVLDEGDEGRDMGTLPLCTAGVPTALVVVVQAG